MTDRTLWLTLILAVLCHLAFAVYPGIDLWVTALFHDSTGFPVVHSVVAQSLRMTLWHLSLLVPVVLLIRILVAMLSGRNGAAGRAAQAGVQLGYLILGPGLVVNEGLKAHWGRARPQDVVEFGGLARFSPPMEMVSECARNCSFVSGEVSMAVAAALVVHWLVCPPMPRRKFHARTVALAVALGLACLISAWLRVAMGRHFVSDAIFGALLMVILHRVTLMLAPQGIKTPHLVLAEVLPDCRAAGGRIFGFIRLAFGLVPDRSVQPALVQVQAVAGAQPGLTDPDRQPLS